MAETRKCKCNTEFGSCDFIKNLGIMSLGNEEKMLDFIDKETEIGKVFVEEMRRLYFLKGESLKEVSPVLGAITRGLIAQHYIRDDLTYGEIRFFVNTYCYAFDCGVGDFWEEIKDGYEFFPILTERKAEARLKNAIRNHLTDEQLEVFVGHAKHGDLGVYDNGEEQKIVKAAAEDLRYFKELINAAIFGKEEAHE